MYALFPALALLCGYMHSVAFQMLIIWQINRPINRSQINNLEYDETW